MNPNSAVYARQKAAYHQRMRKELSKLTRDLTQYNNRPTLNHKKIKEIMDSMVLLLAKIEEES